MKGAFTHHHKKARIRTRYKSNSTVQTVLVKTSMRERKYRLKNYPTLAEKCLLRALKAHKLSFQFQKSFDTYYITDFFFKRPGKRYHLVIEVDGHSHDDRKTKDLVRDYQLETHYATKVFRIGNTTVITNTEAVVQWIQGLLGSIE